MTGRAITVLSILVAFTSCSELASEVDELGDYVVSFPSLFQEYPSELPGERRWATKDWVVEVTSQTLNRASYECGSLGEFQDWLAFKLELSRPSFFKAANGLQVALNTSDEATRIVIILPESSSYWSAAVFSVSGAFDNTPLLRETRELAIAAILGGHLVVE